MYLWTVQRKKVIETLAETGEYYPNVKKSKGYNEMKLIYPLLLESFNALNNSSFNGMIFGFYKVNGGKAFETIEDLYDYLYKNQSVSAAFNFWNSDSAILQIKINSNINIMPVDFNDVIKLSMGKTKDIERISLLYNSIDEFNADVYNIITYMNEGKINPYTLFKSFIEGHYPYIKVEDILGIFPNFDLQTSRKKSVINLFNFSDDSENLQKLIKKH